VDEFVDDLLTKDRLCATSLWKMPKREVLEDLEVLEPRVSPLGDLEDILEEEDDQDQNGDDQANGEREESGEISEREDMQIDERRPRTESRSP
jgi:pre-mRNA-splicing factor 38A